MSVPPDFLEGLSPEREQARQQWRAQAAQQFIERLKAILAEGLGRNPGTPPQPSNLNEQITAMSGRSGPPQALGPPGAAPQDEFLQYLLANQQLNQGGPPGPEMAGADPPLPPPGPLGYGANEPGARADPLTNISMPQDDLEPGMRGRGVTVESDTGGHPPATREFLASLVGDRPELLAMQSPENPTRNTRSGMGAVAIEILNEWLAGQGMRPLEFGSEGAAGYPAWAEQEGQRRQAPDFARNAVSAKQRAAGQQIQGMPGPVQEMLAPDAAAQIAQNPRGQLTPGASRLLGQPGLRREGTERVGNSADLAKLRTDQMNMILGAGPDRGSLMDPSMVSGPEAAMARQMGGIDQFATGVPGAMTRDPVGAGNAELERVNPGSSRYFYPEAGLPEPSATPPVGRAGMTAPEIGDASSGVLQKLLDVIPHDWGAERGADPGEMPQASLPDPRKGPAGMEFVDELKRMLGAQKKPGSEFAEDSTFPDQQGVRPTFPNQLERSVAETEGVPLGMGGADVLESRGSGALGLDAPGNIRAGGPGGQVISGSFLDELLGNVKGRLGAVGKGVGRGLGGAALNVAPQALDMYSANNFAQALTGANEQFGGVMAPDSQGNMTAVPINPGMAALYSMVPFLFDRRKFAEDPQYRRQMLGAENIPEAA